MKKSVSFFLFLVLLCNSASLLAQDEPESIVPEEDKFQDYFYESVLQKGIENYDKALLALDQCAKIKPNDAIVYSEMGKNYYGLKNYEQSYSSYEKASQIDPKNKWFWVGMYDVSYQTRNFNQAIIIVTKLIEFDSKYKEDLMELYMNTQQFDQALVLIDELNEKVGKSDRRDAYKAQIVSQGKYQNREIDNLVVQIQKNPKVEANYISLIKLYSDNNQTQKALEITKKLEKEIPSSEWSQLGLLNIYINKNYGPNALSALNVILASNTIDAKVKQSALKEYIVFVSKNPQYLEDLEKTLLVFETQPDVIPVKDVAHYYYAKKQWTKAVIYYEMALKNSGIDDIEMNTFVLQCYVEEKQFDLLTQKATSLAELYPSQPQFYYFAGLAFNQKKEFKKAVTMLETGIDFVIDNQVLEVNFNLQLGESYNGLGDFKKKDQYFAKANQLLKVKK